MLGLRRGWARVVPRVVPREGLGKPEGCRPIFQPCQMVYWLLLSREHWDSTRAECRLSLAGFRCETPSLTRARIFPGLAYKILAVLEVWIRLPGLRRKFREEVRSAEV